MFSLMLGFHMRFFLFFFLCIRSVLADSPDLQLAQGIFDTQEMGAAIETPIPGVFQFSQGSEVFYISADGRYIMQGEIIDLKNQRNITEAFRANRRLKIISQLNPQQTIHFEPNQTRYKVKIFVDVNCPYCRLIQSRIKDYLSRGIAIEYFAFPRAGMNSPDAEMLKQVFCASNPAQALIEAEEDKFISDHEPKNCPQVKEHYTAGLAIGVIGTPALLLEDGTLIPGFVAPENLEAILKKHTKK